MPLKLTIASARRSSTANIPEDEKLLLSSPTDSAIEIPFDDDSTEFKLPTLVTLKTQQIYSKSQKTTSVSTLNVSLRFLFIITCALFWLFGIYQLARTIPNLSHPTSIENVKQIAIILEDYSTETWQGYVHILAVFCLIYIWKQAFSVPGAIFLNILAGAIYGPINATIITSLLTAIGASGAYLLGKFIAQPMSEYYLSEKLSYLRKQVEENRDNLFYYLLFIRMFPLSPWWLLNIGSPLVYIPIGPFFASMFFGSIPYNFASCQAGNILAEIQSTADIWDPLLLLKMLFVSLLFLIPPLLSKKIKNLAWERTKPEMVSV
ncbi:hypothetical protein G9A89_007280 [Geosiphon pyriformis]|nr:hypothetical protein G9A89_007280 [Geosiphon pyriformis]